ncbi:phage tail tape measure protein, TP901 family [Fibrella aestuarina BUZ 2]|uniref:Phage tail tape measure protein, TP901 family n=1 Tax=Fibrella aestuarina BUZ 2 TaxID=1166018 RepID=I0KBX5_9BACT|nr:phage tail tape measure protein [Fibrella aestuarina]CCH01628.1 phage tail tape measure protein, TP901 family [Fibrella aestuarina BUZ 2]
MANQQERAVIDLVINGEQAKASLKQIKAEAIDARKEFNRMAEADDPAAYAKKAEQVKLLESAARSMGDRLKETASGWQTFLKEGGTILAGVAGGNIATWGLETLVGLIPMAIDKSVKLRDQFADIAKTTGMADSEIQALNKDLKDINTRTPTKELRDMAAVGGQFGVAKEQISGFVKATDIANVALGDQFENAEAVATEMTGLRNVLGDIKTDDVGTDMLHIANTINALESAGAATAPVLADMTSRIGGVAVPLGLTSAQVLGLSATLQELNVTSERGSTAVVDILNGMAKAPDAFAKYARAADGTTLSTKEFAHLVNTDMMGALRAVIKGFGEGDATATGMAHKLDEMGMNGNGVMEVFMKLASNTDMLDKRIGLAQDTILSTDSVMGEFNKKNYDLAVNLKKLSEWFGGLLSKSGLPGFAEWLVTAATKVLGLTSASESSMKAFESQRDSIKSLQKDTEPLLKRHDELKAKTKLTTTEQQELDKIIKAVAGSIPQAVTQFDAMGNAMAISTEKAREYVKQQKEVLKYTNRQAIADTDEELTNARSGLQFLINKRKAGKEVVVSKGNSGSVQERVYTTAELQQLDADIAAKNKAIADLETRRSGLSGDYLEEKESTRRRNERRQRVDLLPSAKSAPTEDTYTESDHERKEREKREKKSQREARTVQKEQETYEKLVEDALERQAKGRDKTFEREQLQFGEHYAKLLKMAGSNKERQAEVQQLMSDELTQIQQREIDRKEKLEEQKAEKERIKQEKQLREQRESDKRSYDLVMGGVDQEHEGRQGKLGLTPDGKINAAQDLRLLELQEEETYLNAKLLVQQAYSQESADTEAALTENHNRQVWLRAQAEKDASDAMREAQWAVNEARREAMSQGLSVLQSFLGQHTVAYKAMVVAMKAFAIAEIIVNTQREISQMWTNRPPYYWLLPDQGASILTAQTVAAKVRAGVGIGTIAAQGVQELAAPGTALAKKDDGGFTGIADLYGDPSGFYSQPTRVNAGRRSYIVGERRREFIMGGAMLENPVFANLALALDAVQRRGDYAPFGQIMGEQARAATSAPAGPDYGPQLLAMNGQLNQLRADMTGLANRPVMLNYRLLEEYEDQLGQVRTETSL